MSLVARRAGELAGMAMIGDGIVAAADPEGHVALWKRGPQWWTKLAEPFARHPQATRALALLEVGLGLLLVRATIAGRKSGLGTDERA